MQILYGLLTPAVRLVALGQKYHHLQAQYKP